MSLINFVELYTDYLDNYGIIMEKRIVLQDKEVWAKEMMASER